MFGGPSKAARLPAPEKEPGPRGPAAVPSFQEVYRQYFELVWSSARRLGVDGDAIDDLVQEVFIVIHARLRTLEQPEALRSWVYGVVRRTVSTHRRATRTQRDQLGTRADQIELASPSPNPLEQTETNAELALLASLLDQMDHAKREIFVLVELEELSVPEAADVLEIPLNTAYSRLRVARQLFETALARHDARTRGK